MTRWRKTGIATDAASITSASAAIATPTRWASAPRRIVVVWMTRAPGAGNRPARMMRSASKAVHRDGHADHDTADHYRNDDALHGEEGATRIVHGHRLGLQEYPGHMPDRDRAEDG